MDFSDLRPDFGVGGDVRAGSEYKDGRTENRFVRRRQALRRNVVRNRQIREQSAKTMRRQYDRHL
jgi:hypothetical protein